MFNIKNLGTCKYDSPLKKSRESFVSDSERILYNPKLDAYKNAIENEMEEPISIELAGPREKLFFDPSKTKAAIVTCGGLCPGLNNVTRAIFLELYYRYGVHDVWGIRYGFAGFI